jgi:hypothetical protein
MQLLGLALLLLQDPSSQARDLIETLRSGKIEEREEAGRKLKALDRGARPELEKALKDPDSEVAGRAKQLLYRLDLKETLPGRLRQAMPGVEDRLSEGVEAEWSRVFLEASELKRPDSRRFLLSPE